MAVFSRLLTSSILAAIAILSAAPESVDALVAGSDLGHIGARHASGHHYITPNHQGRALTRRRNDHQYRKRCVERPYVSPSSTVASSTAAPPPPSQTPTPPTPPNNGGYAGGGKFLIAWPNGNDDNFSRFVTSKVGYYYTWSPHKVNVDTRGVKFAPMLHGHKHIGDWQALVKPGYADVALAMNEPDHGEQSPMDPQTGADLWNTYIGPLRYQGYRLGSPATTNGPSGLAWMQDFLPRIGEKPDFLALHWYGTRVSEFIAHVENYRAQAGGYNVWITEFACMDFSYRTSCSEGDAWAFMTEASAWLNNNGWVEAYAPFGIMRDMGNVSEVNRLMNGDGSPTTLGYAYIN